jgi:hypothetical protein
LTSAEQLWRRAVQWSDEFIVEQAEKVRQRAFCNAVKRRVLGDAADPWVDQAEEVAAAPLGNPGASDGNERFLVSEAQTFRDWWSGTRSPQRKRVIERLPEALQWLEDGHLGSPVQRHLEVLSAFAMRAESAADVVARRNRLKTMREACNQSWAVLTSSCPQTDLVMRFPAGRLLGASELPPPSLRYADERDRLRLACGGLNPYSFEVPADVRRSFSSADRFGLLRFLLRLSAALPVADAWWHQAWVFDVASMLLLARASLVDRLTPMPVEQLGELYQPVVMAGRAIWDHEVGMTTPMLMAPTLPEFEHGQWTMLLGWLREAYYDELAKLGLRFEDLYPITQPVKVVGAQRITDNVVWAGGQGPQAGTILGHSGLDMDRQASTL